MSTNSIQPKQYVSLLPVVQKNQVTGNDIIDKVSEISKPILGVAGSLAATAAISVGVGAAAGAGMTALTGPAIIAAPIVIPAVGAIAGIAGGTLLNIGAKTLLPKLGINLNTKLF